MKTTKLAYLGLLLALESCATEQPVGLITPEFGEAVRHNIAIQTVNPAAPVDRSPLVTDGARAAVGQGRYITDMVEKPEAIATQAQQSASGSNGPQAGGAAGAR